MSECVTALIEEWQFSESQELDETRGLARLRQRRSSLPGGQEDSGEAVVRALLARFEGDSPHLDGEQLLYSFTFLCHRLWSPLPHFLDFLLSTSSTHPHPTA